MHALPLCEDDDEGQGRQAKDASEPHMPPSSN